MAVAQTGAIFKTLEFDGESSGNYGVYISGEAVFNAPERDVEMISIPGRNGFFALDKGRFENIEVTYPAGIFADNEIDFAKAVSDFRNFLCSRNGYCRLTDGYNPDEYRLAIYKSGLEVSPAQLKAGEFEITFDCKPERYLMSGESAISVTSGDTILNPTLFESKPLLKVWGTGDIHLNSDVISIDSSAIIGEIQLSPQGVSNSTLSLALSNTENLDAGDDIYKVGGSTYAEIGVKMINPNYRVGSVLPNAGAYYRNPTENTFICGTDPSTTGYGANGLYLNYGTSTTYEKTPMMVSFFLYDEDDVESIATVLVITSIVYDGDAQITVDVSASFDPTIFSLTGSKACALSPMFGNSTKAPYGYPPFNIDLEVGEAWATMNGSEVSINNLVSIPAELPKMKTGSNEITYPTTTISKLEIIPRWWKV